MKFQFSMEVLSKYGDPFPIHEHNCAVSKNIAEPTSALLWENVKFTVSCMRITAMYFNHYHKYNI